MTKKLNKDITHQLRFSKDQDHLLNEAYKHYISDSENIITMSEFMRQQLMLQCLKILRIIETRSERTPEPEVVVEEQKEMANE